MRALAYHGPGRKAWEEVQKPQVTHDTDAIVGVDAATICGTGLHTGIFPRKDEDGRFRYYTYVINESGYPEDEL